MFVLQVLIPLYQQMLHSSGKNRLSPQKFLDVAGPSNSSSAADSEHANSSSSGGGYFDSFYVETMLFLENIALKEAYEKDKFFMYVHVTLYTHIDAHRLTISPYHPTVVVNLRSNLVDFRVLY